MGTFEKHGPSTFSPHQRQQQQPLSNDLILNFGLQNLKRAHASVPPLPFSDGSPAIEQEVVELAQDAVGGHLPLEGAG